MGTFDKYLKKPHHLSPDEFDEIDHYPWEGAPRQRRRLVKGFFRIIREFETHLILLLLVGLSFGFFFITAKVSTVGFHGIFCQALAKSQTLSEIFGRFCSDKPTAGPSSTEAPSGNAPPSDGAQPTESTP
ncbi:MAG: hypothetical protein OZSIB_0141 [Candidatus Ozemobacter sibiricus]|jgi:hypothetical protein|uniref:Uncharacterized protein n=1 Tax=Candidatus Ozemobacter sibiricus TaxID=2268124 RepID=A0A367ZMJ9_9BACT|nr:MAG: hypothetical protein OZSIB_0141 [Candidatus Ozemobacter sibiricus]